MIEIFKVKTGIAPELIKRVFEFADVRYNLIKYLFLFFLFHYFIYFIIYIFIY